MSRRLSPFALTGAVPQLVIFRLVVSLFSSCLGLGPLAVDAHCFCPVLCHPRPPGCYLCCLSPLSSYIPFSSRSLRVHIFSISQTNLAHHPGTSHHQVTHPTQHPHTTTSSLGQQPEGSLTHTHKTQHTTHTHTHTHTHTLSTSLVDSCREPQGNSRDQLATNKASHAGHPTTPCATSWLSSTRRAGASTTSTRLIVARHTADQAMASSGEPFLLATPAATTHHTPAATTTRPTRLSTRTRATTRGGHPRALATTTDEECCLRRRRAAVLGIPRRWDALSFGTGSPTSTRSE